MSILINFWQSKWEFSHFIKIGLHFVKLPGAD